MLEQESASLETIKTAALLLIPEIGLVRGRGGGGGGGSGILITRTHLAKHGRDSRDGDA